MIAIHISDIGEFMNQLLKTPLFDHFLLQEASILCASLHQIDGRINKDYFSSAELLELHLQDLTFLPFSELRPICLQLMKGRKKPGFFKFVFLLSPENQKNTLIRSGSHFSSDEISGMFLNIMYKNGILTCTTAISYSKFTMDKTLDQEWDRLVMLFFRQNKIAYEAQ